VLLPGNKARFHQVRNPLMRRVLQAIDTASTFPEMKTADTVALHVELPASIPKEEARLMLALKLYEKGRLTLGQAAHTAGYSKRAFIDLLGQEGVPVLNSDPGELAAESGW
jgi:predicted HTH domain antitoxin